MRELCRRCWSSSSAMCNCSRNVASCSSSSSSSSSSSHPSRHAASPPPKVPSPGLPPSPLGVLSLPPSPLSPLAAARSPRSESSSAACTVHMQCTPHARDESLGTACLECTRVRVAQRSTYTTHSTCLPGLQGLTRRHQLRCISSVAPGAQHRARLPHLAHLALQPTLQRVHLHHVSRLQQSRRGWLVRGGGGGGGGGGGELRGFGVESYGPPAAAAAPVAYATRAAAAMPRRPRAWPAWHGAWYGAWHGAWRGAWILQGMATAKWWTCEARSKGPAPARPSLYYPLETLLDPPRCALVAQFRLQPRPLRRLSPRAPLRRLARLVERRPGRPKDSGNRRLWRRQARAPEAVARRPLGRSLLLGAQSRPAPLGTPRRRRNRAQTLPSGAF